MPPTVTLTGPAANAVYKTGDNVTLAANASDSDGIHRVEFFNGSTKLGTATGSSFGYTWTNVPAGIYTLIAVTYDIKGTSTTSRAVTISVRGPITGNIDGIGSDANGRPVLYGWACDKGDVRGTKVAFYIGDAAPGGSSSRITMKHSMPRRASLRSAVFPHPVLISCADR